MADPGFERRLRRAFSHREKARQLERECARAYDAGRIESTRYASLREFYAKHIREAEASIHALRKEAQERRASFLEQFGTVDAAQGALSQQLAAGTIKPEAANRKNRKLMKTANECRQAMAECDRLLAITSADEAGGFLDLPLAEFSQPVMPVEDEDEDFDWERALTYALPFLIATMVFLPWLTLGGVSKSLPGLEDFGGVLGLPSTLGTFPTRLAWVVYMLLPLLALPLAAMSRNRPSGLGLILCGFLLLWAIIAGVLGVPWVSRSEDITLTALIQALHFGPFLYFGGAVGLIVLGQRRLQRRELQTESGSRAILIMSACMVFLMVVAASSVWLQVQEGFVSYDARTVDARTGAVNIVLTNEGRVPAAVYAPWPRGVPERLTGAPASDIYGLGIQVRELGMDTFQGLPDSRGAWVSAGLPVTTDDPLLIPPRSRVVLTFVPWQLRALGVEPDAVRIQFSRGAGERIGESEHAMPEFHAEPPVPVRIPVPRTLPSTEFPTPLAEEESAPQDATPREEPAPMPVGTVVMLTGLLGDRAVLQVVLEGGSPTRMMRGPDEVITGDWVVLEVGVAPPSVTLFHERTYETVTLPMGEAALLHD